MYPDGRMSLKRIAWVASLLLVLAYCGASVFVCRRAWAKRLDCGMPCPIPKASDALGACGPVRMDFEIFSPIAKRNTRYTLWYRIKLTNQSCYEVRNFELNDLMFSLDEMGSVRFPESNALNFRVWGPDGKELKQGMFAKSSDYHSLYRASEQELGKWNKEADRAERRLAPGQSFTSIPSELAPIRRTTQIDWSTGRHGIGYERIEPPTGTEKPPKGFRILDSYSFDRPGSYKIQALYSHRVSAALPTRALEDVPWPLRLPVGMLSAFGLSIQPAAFDDDIQFDLRLESQVFAFRVE